MKKLIAVIAAAGMTAAAANANPHTTPEMAKEAQAEIVKALNAAADKLAAEAKALMPEWDNISDTAEMNRAAAHRKAIIADEIAARAAAEEKKLQRIEKPAKTRKGKKAKKANN